MANSGLQLLGFTLCLLGVIANLTSTILPQWRVSSFAEGSIITAQSYQLGLWMECVWQSTGQLQCKIFDSMFSLSPAMQATRALMVISIILGVIGGGIATMGMKCTHCGDDNKVTKARIAMTGGLVFIVGGLASLVACSWMAHQIITDFYNPMSPTNKRYEMGASVYLGWAGAALLLLGGGLLACSCPGDSGYKGRQYPQGKPVSKPPSSREYV
ncbi:claudin-7-like [Python bivittatus]|uniref:Claudin n=1 Tax=Python bivittatus TaxID=176946 RepID=A0A9F2WH34_PYTBI|nr:claudin-7-like [Python bivittatus]